MSGISRGNRIMPLWVILVAFASVSSNLHAISATQVALDPSPVFDHIVIIAMENQPEEILGTANTPFLNTLMAAGSTLAQDNHYPDGVSCSSGCYVEFTSGAPNGDGVSDGYDCCLSLNNIANQSSGAGLSWQAYCEAGCPRGNDHFPFSAYSDLQGSPNLFTGSSVSVSTFIAAANSANPPNYLWYTPTDSHNMHDNSISSGDSYLKTFLVGDGNVTLPASGSLLASNLFTNPNYHTLLFVWWDECNETNGASFSCDSNNNAANIEYATAGFVKAGFVSQAPYNEFSELATIEVNWGLSRLGSAASSPPITDIFKAPPAPLATSFVPSTYNLTVAFTANATGGLQPYSFNWGFGDGATRSGQFVNHTYSTSGTYSVTLNTSDSETPRRFALYTFSVTVSTGTVGGLVVPVDLPAVAAPFIGLASFFTLATVLATIGARRSKTRAHPIREISRIVWETASIYSTFPYLAATRTMLGRLCSSAARRPCINELPIADWLELIGAKSEAEVDPEEWNLRRYLVRDSGCFIDVGGSLGVQSKYASDSNMEVFSFEPNPKAVKILRRVVPRAHVFPYAVGNEDRDKFPFKSAADYGHSTLTSNTLGSEIFVRMVRLDSIRFPRAGVIKIDTEGWELSVLQGGADLIKRDRPRVIVEIHKPYEQQKESIMGFMQALGYVRIRQVWKPMRRQYHLVFFEPQEHRSAKFQPIYPDTGESGATYNVEQRPQTS